MTKKSTRTRARTTIICASAAASGMAVAALIAGPAHADQTFTSFRAVASANGFEASLANPQTIPIVDKVQLAGPTAQSDLDSLADSDAFAAFPYPGADVATLPGLVNALFGVPVPAYPAFVSTANGDKPARQQLPGVDLQARSTPALSTATAVAGSGATNASSTVETSVDSSTASASATSDIDGLNLGGILRISGVRSTATASRDTTGALTTTSHLSFGQITVPGLSITIPTTTPAQIPIPIPIPGIPQPPPIAVPTLSVPLGGQTVSAPDLGFEDGTFTVTLPKPGGTPTTFAVPADSVLSAFKAAGITVTYQAPQKLVDAKGNQNGIEAAGLSFTFVIPEPPPPINSQVHGATTVTFDVGRDAAQVDSSVPKGIGGTPSSPPNVTSATPPVSAGNPGSTPAVTAGGGSDAGGGSFGTGALPGTGLTTEPGSVPAPEVTGPAPAQQTSTQALGRKTVLTDSADLYLVLIVGAACALGAFNVIRLLGVRHA